MIMSAIRVCREKVFLCASAKISVSLWCKLHEKTLTTETQRSHRDTESNSPTDSFGPRSWVGLLLRR